MSNPIWRQNFENEVVLDGEPMSINGAIQKSLLLTTIIIISAIYTVGLVLTGFTDKATLLGVSGLIISAIAGFVIVLARPKISNILAIIYSIGEGFALGLISAYYETQYHGIVLNAIFSTFATMFAMLALYRFRIIRCDEKFRSVIFTATASIAIIYLIQIVASFFGRGIPQIFTASPFGIGFSIIVVLIAAFNFIVDFDFIENGEKLMLPKLYEWIGAVSLMFSLVWLYLEILRLLFKLNSRR